MVLDDFERDPNRISVAFVTYYYNLLNSNHTKLYQVYHKDAILRHNDFKNPFSSEAKDIIGIDKIREHWLDSPFGGAKVMIQSIESTNSFHDSILIVAVGELALKGDENESSYKFVQTFVLVPMEGKDVYDVYNDVLTFVPDVDYEYVEEDEQKEKSGEEVQVSKELDTKPIEESKQEFAETHEIPEPAKEQEVEEGGKKEKRGREVEGEKHEEKHEEKLTDKEVDSTAVDDVDEAEKVGESLEKASTVRAKKPVAPLKPTTGLSWANQIASSAAATATAAIKPPTAASAHVVVKAKKDASPSPSGSKKGSRKREGRRHHHQESDSDDGFERVGGNDVKKNSRQNSLVNKKGQTVYPIYVKGIDKDTNEGALVKALENAFGRIDSCRMERNAAYVDFVERDPQKRALSRHLFRLGNIEIKLEPRLKRDGNSLKKKKNRNARRRNNPGNGGSTTNADTLTDDGFKRVGKH